jgi:hypothetical protein
MKLENIVFDLVIQFPIGYETVMGFDMRTLNRLIERINEKATGRSRLTDDHKEMIRMAKEERKG